MIPYTSNDYNRKNVDALAESGWRILLTPQKPVPRDGFKFAIDNGAWRAFQGKTEFDSARFRKLVERHGCAADFVIVPDIVAGGMESLEFSHSWLPYLKSIRSLLLPVQDGMDVQAVGSLLHSWTGLGIFLGGSTEYKLATMYAWGMVAHSRGRHFHVGRVNSVRRIGLAHEAGADSIDGSSPSMYLDKVVRLSPPVRQPSLLTPAMQHGATT